MAQTSLPFAPPSSPNLSFTTLNDAQELVKAVMDMQMATTHAPRCTCSHTPPEDPSEATPTDLCSPTPCHTSPTNQTSSQVVTTEHVQQFWDIPNSLITKQGPPPPPTKPSGESGEPKARASRLEFKAVNEVYVSNAARIQAY
jgi:hypothetical protein